MGIRFFVDLKSEDIFSIVGILGARNAAQSVPTHSKSTVEEGEVYQEDVVCKAVKYSSIEPVPILISFFCKHGRCYQ
jgi:hypothetical protein